MAVLIRQLWGLRGTRFLVVAGTCTLLQEVILLTLTRRFGFEKVLANGIGFAIAAQANFTLSAWLTWGDRELNWTVRETLVRWARFNVVAIAALLVNEVVFTIIVHKLATPVVAASLFGILVGALVTYTCNNSITFRGSHDTTTEIEDSTVEEVMEPGLETVRAATKGRAFVCFVPAYNEEENLCTTISKLVMYLRSLAFSAFRVVIVNDGSKDRTYPMAQVLAFTYPEVVAYHHNPNRGYGGALATGLNACVSERFAEPLEWSRPAEVGRRFEWWGFMDCDRQIPHQFFGALFTALHENGVDLAVGRRVARESRFRQRLGRAWHHYSGVIIGRKLLRGVDDIDAGMKVGRIDALETFAHRLFGAKAAISPELVARSTMAGHSIAQCDVPYTERTAGKSTGSNPKVMLVSGLHILLVGIALRMERYFGLMAQPAPKGTVMRCADGSTMMPVITASRTADDAVPKGRHRKPHLARISTSWIVGTVAAVLSIAALTVTARLHAALLYGDSMSHEEVARRMIDGSTPGLAQMGGVWPPFPHLLMLPFIWYNPWYTNGFAGSIVSMGAYVVTTVLIYKIITVLTDKKFAGIVGAVVFALNANVLYMGAIPMTESVFFATLAGMVYCTQRWIMEDRRTWLVLGAVMAFLATLTRYEAWPILATFVVIVVIVAWRRYMPTLEAGLRRRRAADRFVYYAFWTSLSILGWMIWNWAIFGNPFAFQTGAYAKPALWLSSHEPAIGNPWVAIKTYGYAIFDNIPWPVLLLALVGLIVLAVTAIRHKQIPWQVMPTLALLVVVPFFVWALYKGQRPLHVPPIEHDLYNVRFGLLPVVPIAVLVGILVASLAKLSRQSAYIFGVLVIAVAVGLCSITLHQHGPVTYREALGSQNPVDRTVAAAFERHYTNGPILAQSFGNEGIIFVMPSRELIYEGSFQKWQPDLRSPSVNGIRWILERCGPSADLVCSSVNRGEIARYRLVWHINLPDGTSYRIYEIRHSFLVTLGLHHSAQTTTTRGDNRDSSRSH